MATKRTTRSSTRASLGPSMSESPVKRTVQLASSPPAQPTPSAVDVPAEFASLRARLASVAAPAPARATWSHTPSNLTLIWLAISLPLVIWDTGYVMLRPLSMPGGSLHSPIWKPYALYGTIDHVYGFKAWDANNGWTLAQGSVNALETAAYLLYLYWVYTYGEQESKQGRGAPAKETMGRWKALSQSRTVRGRVAAWAVLLAFSTAWLTFSKTVLYWLTEAFSGFDNIGHNDAFTLFFLWIIPNGAWLVLPAYMMVIMGREILQGLEAAANGGRKYR